MNAAHSAPTPAYRLDQWLGLRMQLLWAYERNLESQTRGRETTLGFQSALHVLDGWIEAGESAALARRAEPGQWLILRQGRRWQRCGPACRLLSIGFRFQLPTGEAVYDRNLPLRIPGHDCPELLRRAREVLRALEQGLGTGFFPRDRVVPLRDYLGAQNAFRDFLTELSEVFAARGCPAHEPESSHRHVLHALTEIGNLSPGTSWTASTVAARVGVSLSHLDRLMVADTGTTVHRQMERHRLSAAEEALQSRAVSLKDIAFQLGFSSPSHFSSWFRKHRGQSPGAFRDNCQHGTDDGNKGRSRQAGRSRPECGAAAGVAFTDPGT